MLSDQGMKTGDAGYAWMCASERTCLVHRFEEIHGCEAPSEEACDPVHSQCHEAGHVETGNPSSGCPSSC